MGIVALKEAEEWVVSSFNVPKVNGLAVTSLVLGLIPCTCIPSVLAVIFGHIALGQIASQPDVYKGRGMALWGTGLGYFFTICNIIYGIACGIAAA